MNRLTRRSILAASGGVLTAMAGCTSENDSADQNTATTTLTVSNTTSDESVGTTTGQSEFLEWTRDVTPTSEPIVVDETIFVGDQNGSLHAIAPNGSDRLTVDLQESVQSIHPTPSAVFVVTANMSATHVTRSVVHAIEPDGSERRWWAEVEGGPGAKILGVTDGVLGIGLHDDYLQRSGEGVLGLAVEDGTELWRAETGDVRDGTAGPKTLYAAEYGSLIAFAPRTGKKYWSIDRDVSETPVMLGDIPLLANGEMRALDPQTGAVRWTYGGDVALDGATVIGSRAYTNGARVAALEDDGTEAWRYDNGGSVTAWSSEFLFGTAEETRLFALSKAGEVQWTGELPDEGFRLDAATDAVVGGITEGRVHVFDQADGSERYTFRTETDHATGIAATTDRLIVGGETRLYGLSG